MYEPYALESEMSSKYKESDQFPSVELCDMGTLHASQLHDFYVTHEHDAIFVLVLKQCLSTCSINNTLVFI